ncbi:hypothetical protein ACQP1G_26380 [Nocardia sp. CA-107356]|uniref:hypothetical protein n=1 Tax=Nocardia sp. CA-107356 TaxID=3239972 RepID=UPI003D8BC628
MPSLEEQIQDTIDDLKRLGPTPDPERVEQLRARLDELVTEVRRTVPTADERRYDLILRSRQAKGLLVDATERVRHNLDTAQAARQRELHPGRIPPARDVSPNAHPSHG